MPLLFFIVLFGQHGQDTRMAHAWQPLEGGTNSSLKAGNSDEVKAHMGTNRATKPIPISDSQTAGNAKLATSLGMNQHEINPDVPTAGVTGPDIPPDVEKVMRRLFGLTRNNHPGLTNGSLKGRDGAKSYINVTPSSYVQEDSTISQKNAFTNKIQQSGTHTHENIELNANILKMPNEKYTNKHNKEESNVYNATNADRSKDRNHGSPSDTYTYQTPQPYTHSSLWSPSNTHIETRKETGILSGIEDKNTNGYQGTQKIQISGANVKPSFGSQESVTRAPYVYPLFVNPNPTYPLLSGGRYSYLIRMPGHVVGYRYFPHQYYRGTGDRTTHSGDSMGNENAAASSHFGSLFWWYAMKQLFEL